MADMTDWFDDILFLRSEIDALFARTKGHSLRAKEWNDRGHAILDRIAALSATPAPSGWKLVPIEPTETMAFVGADYFWQSENDAAEGYRRMIAAAPEAGGQNAADEAEHLRRCELEQIADGAYGDGPRTRGAARDQLVAMDATPAPSDQDASQAQGEVERIVAYIRRQSDLGANRALEKEKGSIGRAAFGGGSLALKRVADNIEAGEHISNDNTAPGATAQDGVERLCSDCPPDAYPTDATRCTPCPRCTQTPTIPAGMVADREAHIAALIAALPQWQREPVEKALVAPARYGVPIIPADAALKAMAALAAAPKQAEQQGVERAAIYKAVRDAWFDGRGSRGGQYDSEGVEATWGRLIDRAIAALNAPTGAVEQ